MSKSSQPYHDSDAFNRNIIDHSPDAMLVLDADARILFLSEGGKRLMELDDESDYIGSLWLDSWEGAYRVEAEGALSAARLGVQGCFQGYRPTKTGKSMWWDVILSPAVEDDGRLVVVERDIRSRKEDETTLKRDVTDEMEHKRQLGQLQKMEALGTLAGGIAHDFNNILSAIIGFSELALDSAPADSRQYSHIMNVLAGGKRAAELVRQILAVSRGGDHQRLPIQIAPIVREAMHLIRASLPSMILIEKDIIDGLEPVNADSIQILQIVMNLCTNANHAMSETGGLLRVELDQVVHIDTLATNRPSGSFIRLRVQDSGKGIEPEILDRIFDPYFTTKEPGEGTGLGLSVVQGIVADHAGYVFVDSQLAVGTTFTVLLPVAGQESLLEPEPGEKTVPGGAEHIFIVDDEQPIVDILESTLNGLGYKVSAFSNSVDALATFAESPGAYDLVITDMTMPYMNGEHLSKKIRSLRPDIPILICTGFSHLLDEEKVISLGINDLLIKPIERGTLAEAVRFALDGI